VDIAGRTAIPGVIDNRLWQKYGGAILLTTISAGAALAVPSGNARLADAYKTLADNLGSISTQILEENLDLRPVITVPAGTRLNIIPLVDLWFPNPRIIAPVPQKGKAGRRNSSRTSPAAKQDGGKTTQRP
jgi:type IV secretory pathway VirB10-like protein